MRTAVYRLLNYATRPFVRPVLLPRYSYARSFKTTSLLGVSLQYQQLQRQIPARGNGIVTIDIYQPPRDSILSSEPRVLLYLPPGPFHAVGEDGADVTRQAPAEDDGVASPTSVPAHLASLLPSPTAILTVRYRVSASPLHRFKYPLPIHDVLFALDWILKEYDMPSSETSAPLENADSKIERPKPIISVYGTHIGASLATMLSLTEYSQMHSTAISSPILNWVDLDERLQNWGNAHNNGSENQTGLSTKMTKRKSKRKRSDLLDPNAVQRLLRLRDRLFTRPSSYFDPFASPMLMLRNPGRDCPVDNMFDDAETEEDVDRIMLSDLEENYQYSDPSRVRDSGYESFGPYDYDIDLSNSAMIQRRKTLKKWPLVRPSRSEKITPVQPPFFNAIVRDERDGEGKILKEQGEEIVELIGKCCYSKSQEQEYRERTRVETITVKEGEDAERQEAEHAARWFQEVWEKKEAAHLRGNSKAAS